MLRRKIYVQFAVMILSVFIFNSCRVENFVEPPDPFEVQTLEPDAETFVLGEGDNAIILKTNKDNVIKGENSVRIRGSIFVQNEQYGDMRLSSGDFELTPSSSKDGNYSDINGFGLAELPKEGLLHNLEMSELVGTPFGFKKGSEFDLGAFNWPVNKDKYYFYYENTNPLACNITSSSLENVKKIAIDPTDPFFFASGDINGTSLGDLSDVGFAISSQGNISFSPLVNFDNRIPSFYGNLYFSGTVPLAEYPIAVSGEAVIGFTDNSVEESDKFFDGETSAFTLGVNGQATFDNEALDWLNVEVVLGQASLAFTVSDDGHTHLSFVGVREMPSETVSDFLYDVIGHDWDFLDYLAPFEQKETFFGQIGNELSDWEMGFKMESYLNLPGYHLDMGYSYLVLNPNEMYFSGEASIAGFNRVGVDGYVAKNGNFKFTGRASQGFHAHAGGLSIGYDFRLKLTLEHKDGTVTFKGSVRFKGKACVSIAGIDICAHFKIYASTTISSDGSFRVCFSIGIGKLGYDVCIDFGKSPNSPDGYIQTMTYEEIPLEMVPVQNRFPAERCE
ncbi:MAG: hypothetical protein GXO87_12200 [Chlorobi bacterium]|nr:hypothetical protein [Chlorobiota bacterium]